MGTHRSASARALMWFAPPRALLPPMRGLCRCWRRKPNRGSTPRSPFAPLINGAVMQAVFILLMEYPLTEEGGDHLMTKACWFVVGAGAFASAILLCMRPQYHRRTYRQHKTPTFHAVVPFPPC